MTATIPPFKCSNLSSASPRQQPRQTARQLRQSYRKRTHKCLHDVVDELRDVDVDATGMAKVWIGVGLQIAATILEAMAAECLVEDIINEIE